MPTSKKHFTIFKHYVHKWWRFFNISHWSLDTRYYRASESKSPGVSDCPGDVIGWAAFNEWGHQGVVICLNKEYDGKETLTEEDLNRYALHEVIHVLLRNLSALGTMRFAVTEEMMDAEQHVVVATLENALMKLDKDGKLIDNAE